MKEKDINNLVMNKDVLVAHASDACQMIPQIVKAAWQGHNQRPASGLIFNHSCYHKFLLSSFYPVFFRPGYLHIGV